MNDRAHARRVHVLLSRVPARHQPLVLTLIATGLPEGAVTALAAGDVDLVPWPATIHVAKVWKQDEHRRSHVGPPKRARRTVSPPDDLVDALFPLLAAKAMDELLFTNTVCAQLHSSASGGPPGRRRSRPHATRRGLTALPIPRTAPVERPRVHDLLHGRGAK